MKRARATAGDPDPENPLAHIDSPLKGRKEAIELLERTDRLLLPPHEAGKATRVHALGMESRSFIPTALLGLGPQAELAGTTQHAVQAALPLVTGNGLGELSLILLRNLGQDRARPFRRPSGFMADPLEAAAETVASMGGRVALIIHALAEELPENRVRATTLANTSVDGTLGVTGATALANTSVGGTLGVTGNTTLSTLGVTGATTLANTSVGGTLGVTGGTTLTNTSVGGTLGVTGATTLAANASVGGALGVTGNTTLSTLGVTGTTTLANTSVGGTLGVAGATTLTNTSVGGTLGVTGATTLGNASVGGTLSVMGATSLGHTSVGGTLGVSGNTTLNTLSVTGTLDSLGDLHASSIVASGPNNTVSVTGSLLTTSGLFSASLDAPPGANSISIGSAPDVGEITIGHVGANNAIPTTITIGGPLDTVNMSNATIVNLTTVTAEAVSTADRIITLNQADDVSEDTGASASGGQPAAGSGLRFRHYATPGLVEQTGSLTFETASGSVIGAPDTLQFRTPTGGRVLLQAPAGMGQTRRAVTAEDPSGNVAVVGAVSVGATLDVSGATTLGGALTVAGDYTSQVGDLTLTGGSASVGGTLDVSGATTLGGPLTVAGDYTSQEGGTLGVTGNTTLANASVGGTLGVTGNTTLANASVGGTLGVTGVATLSNNTSVGGTLGVTGATTLGGSVTVTGNYSSTNGTMTLTNGTAAIGGVVTITNTTQGATAPTGALVCRGGAYISRNLFVGGATGETGATDFGNITQPGSI
eukprot:tig00000681_g3091.t1